MSLVPGFRRLGSLEAPASLVPLSLLPLLAILPPETSVESMVGCAALLALLVALTLLRLSAGPGVVALSLALVLSCALARSAVAPGVSVEPMAVAFLAGAAGLAVAALLPRTRRSAKPAVVVAVTGGLVALRAVYQSVWGLEALASHVRTASAVPDRNLVLARLLEGRAYAGFVTPAALGCFLAMAVPMTVGLALSRRDRWRWALLAVAGLQVGGILASASLTAAGALLVAVTLAVLPGRSPRRTAAPAIGLLVLLLAGILVFRGGAALSSSDPDSPWRMRAGNVRVACEMIRDHPWIGVGPGGYGELFPLYRRPGDNESRHAHSLPFELATETGVLGGVILTVLFYALFLVPLWRFPKTDPPWRRGISIGLAAFAIQNLADFTALLPSVLWTAALLRGWIAEDRPEVPYRSGWERILRGALLVGTLTATVVAAMEGLAQHARMTARQAASDGDPASAAIQGARAFRLAPWSADAAILRAQVMLDDPQRSDTPEARLADALTQVDRAVVLSPVRPAARELRSRIRFAMGDLPGAYADLTEAARLYPMKTEYAARRDRLALQLRRGPGAEGRP